MALLKIAAQQALDGIGHLARRATITHGAAKARVLAHGAAETEIVGILDAATDLELFTFQTDIGNTVLAATIRTARDVEFQLLIKLRNTLLQFFHQPPGEGLGFCNS